MVSVLMSTYNESVDEVVSSVESILNQTYQDMELIIVLDNPNNIAVNQWIKEVACDLDGKVHIIEHQQNCGLVQSLNDAFAVAKGNLLARMDADDICMETRIEKQVKYMMEHPECDILGCNRIDIDEKDNIISNQRKVLTEDKQLKKILKFGSPFTHPSIMMRRSVLEKVGGYRNVKYAEDYDLYLRCLKEGMRFANLGEALVKYRIRESGISLGRAYEMLLGKKCAYAFFCESNKACPTGMILEEKIENYKEYISAIKKRKITGILKAVIKDFVLLDELYRNIMFKLLYRFGGSNAD